MTKADSVAAAIVENESAKVALAAAPSDAAAIDRVQAAQKSLDDANALSADESAPVSSLPALTTMDVAKVDTDAHAAAVVAATEIHNVALELNAAIVGNQPQAARSLRDRYDSLIAKLEGK